MACHFEGCLLRCPKAALSHCKADPNEIPTSRGELFFATRCGRVKRLMCSFKSPEAMSPARGVGIEDACSGQTSGCGDPRPACAKKRAIGKVADMPCPRRRRGARLRSCACCLGHHRPSWVRSSVWQECNTLPVQDCWQAGSFRPSKSQHPRSTQQGRQNEAELFKGLVLAVGALPALQLFRSRPGVHMLHQPVGNKVRHDSCPCIIPRPPRGCDTSLAFDDEPCKRECRYGLMYNLR